MTTAPVIRKPLEYVAWLGAPSLGDNGYFSQANVTVYLAAGRSGKPQKSRIVARGYLPYPD